MTKEDKNGESNKHEIITNGASNSQTGHSMGTQSMEKRPSEILLDAMVEHKQYLIGVTVSLMMQDSVLSPSIRHIL